MYEVIGRGARRDFWDLHGILLALSMGLLQALTLFQEKYPIEDIGHVIRSLVYFADAESEPPLVELVPEDWATIKADFTAWVLKL